MLIKQDSMSPTRNWFSWLLACWKWFSRERKIWNNLKLDNIFLTPKIFRKIAKVLKYSKTFAPDCILVVDLWKCGPEFSYTLFNIFSIYLNKSCFQDCWRSHLTSLCFRMKRRLLWFKTPLRKSTAYHLEKWNLVLDFNAYLDVLV